MLSLISNLIKNPSLVSAALLSSSISIPAYSLQANTPQGALEEIATADKPEILVRHLPEPIQKSIEALPKPKKLEVLSQLMQMKAEQFDNCTVASCQRRYLGDRRPGWQEPGHGKTGECLHLRPRRALTHAHQLGDGNRHLAS